MCVQLYSFCWGCCLLNNCAVLIWKWNAKDSSQVRVKTRWLILSVSDWYDKYWLRILFHFLSCCSTVLFQALQHTDCIWILLSHTVLCCQLDVVLTNHSTYIKHQRDIHAQCTIYIIYYWSGDLQPIGSHKTRHLTILKSLIAHLLASNWAQVREGHMVSNTVFPRIVSTRRIVSALE